MKIKKNYIVRKKEFVDILTKAKHDAEKAGKLNFPKKSLLNVKAKSTFNKNTLEEMSTPTFRKN